MCTQYVYTEAGLRVHTSCRSQKPKVGFQYLPYVSVIYVLLALVNRFNCSAWSTKLTVASFCGVVESTGSNVVRWIVAKDFQVVVLANASLRVKCVVMSKMNASAGADRQGTKF